MSEWSDSGNHIFRSSNSINKNVIKIISGKMKIKCPQISDNNAVGGQYANRFTQEQWIQKPRARALVPELDRDKQFLGNVIFFYFLQLSNIQFSYVKGNVLDVGIRKC